MNGEMLEMVDKGELSEASYKDLVESMGPEKAVGAPLYEATYTESVIFANSHRNDEHELSAVLVHFKTDYMNAPKTKIVHGIEDNEPGFHDAAVLFHKYHEIEIKEDGELFVHYKPGYTMIHNMECDEPGTNTGTGSACMIIYTVINIREFNKKRKSHADSDE